MTGKSKVTAALIKVLKTLLFIVFIVSIASCTASRKSPYYARRAKASKVNTSQLGRNRYYFSSDYQKKLYKSYKKK